jgi:hypothetical protein
MAAGVARSKEGSITGTFSDSAEREGAYRFVENDAVHVQDIIEASAAAAFRRAAAERYSFLFAPVDGSTLSIATATEEGGFGPVSPGPSTTLGLESMNCILVSPRGVVVGVGGQRFWARSRRRQPKRHAGQRPIQETENVNWLHVMEQAQRAQRAAGPQAPKLWFQLDRGADARDLLVWASQQDAWVTIRAAQDRRVTVPEESLLWSALEAQPVAGRYTLDLLGTAKRKPRRATIEVRFTSVLFPLRNGWSKDESPAPLYVVYAKEVGCPKGAEPIEWMLLTNYEVLDLEAARLVIEGYAMRWKVEEVHRTWKTTCRVEKAALEEVDHFERWAAILFAAAVRIERLKTLARGNEGRRSASEEFDAAELEALQTLRQPKRVKNQSPTIAEAVRWLADLGGYTGPSSGDPPGAVTLARGLRTLAPAAELLRRMRQPLTEK